MTLHQQIPDHRTFVSERLTRPFRLGLLALTLVPSGLLVLTAVTNAIWPAFLLIGCLFLLVLVYMPLLLAEARIPVALRWIWSAMFILAGPVSLVLFWFIFVWPARDASRR